MPARRRGGNPPFEATDEQRRLVTILAAAGHTQKTIAARICVSVDTLQRHLKDEFDEGADLANSAIGEVLYRKALNGEIKAIENWYDRRGGPNWRKRTASETSGPDGAPIQIVAQPRRYDLSHLSIEELEQFERLTAKLETRGDAPAHE